MSGKLQTKTISKVLVNRSYLIGIAEVILLMGLGVLAVTLHAYLRYPLNLPGHHGIEFMALLIAGYKISHFKASSTIFSLGASMFLLFPLMGIKDVYAPLVYMMPGIMLYLITELFNMQKNKFWFIALVGGIAYASIPLTGLLIMIITNYPYKSLITHEPFYVISSFFAFGLTGTLFTTGIFKSIKQIKFRNIKK